MTAGLCNARHPLRLLLRARDACGRATGIERGSGGGWVAMGAFVVANAWKEGRASSVGWWRAEGDAKRERGREEEDGAG